MRKNREIFILFLLLILTSCKGKNNVSQNIDQQNYISESIQTSEKEPFFISDGCINITKKLNVRNAPSVKGKTIRQASFGDCFHIWEEKGSKTTKDGVYDLWYKISADKEEWINALYSRKFPFYISSEERLKALSYDGEYRKLTVKIEGYREIDGKKELMADVEGFDRAIGYYFCPVAFRGFVELQEKYSFPLERKKFENYNKHEFDEIVSTAQLEYKVTLLDSMFEILRNYSLEMEEINNLYNRFNDAEEGGHVYLDGKEVYFGINDVDYERYRLDYDPWSSIEKFNINSSEIVLTGIRVGSKGDDVFVYFGNDFTSFSKGYSELITYSLGYYYNHEFFPYRIIFDLVDGKVKKITRLCVFSK